jgi:hypothetical protein
MNANWETKEDKAQQGARDVDSIGILLAGLDFQPGGEMLDQVLNAEADLLRARARLLVDRAINAFGPLAAWRIYLAVTGGLDDLDPGEAERLAQEAYLEALLDRDPERESNDEEEDLATSS